jgi:predicted dehydrogenase
MRVAVAGLGWWGKQIISSIGKSPRFKILYGVDPLPVALDFLASHDIHHASDLAAILADPKVDGVILATPHQLHEEQCLAVLAAGKELFCEKPLTMTAAGARRIIDACEKAGKVLGIGHERRYEEGFEFVQKLVAEGALGGPLLYEANISHDLFKNIDRANWRLDPKHAPAGMMAATGIHQTDLCVALLGAERGEGADGEPHFRAARDRLRHHRPEVQIGCARHDYLAVMRSLLWSGYRLW